MHSVGKDYYFSRVCGIPVRRSGESAKGASENSIGHRAVQLEMNNRIWTVAAQHTLRQRGLWFGEDIRLVNVREVPSTKVFLKEGFESSPGVVLPKLAILRVAVTYSVLRFTPRVLGC